jgi:hypothetical protein
MAKYARVCVWKDGKTYVKSAGDKTWKRGKSTTWNVGKGTW